MKSSTLCQSFRQAALLGLAAAACLCAGSVSAQTAPFTYQVINNTFSGGDPNFPVTDDLTFTNLLVTETFGDGSVTPLSLADLDTGVIAEETSPFSFDGSHGFLKSAILTGTLYNGLLPSSTLDLTLQQTPGGLPAVQTVSTAFSADLLQPSQPGIGVGQFDLLFNGNPFLAPVQINAAPVPEASTMVSMSVLLMLGLGGLLAARRRTPAAK